MSDHLTQQQIGSYRSRQISAEELRRLDAHLAVCTDCAQRLMPPETRARSVAAWRTLAMPGTPLSYEQLEAYVENTLSPEARQEIEARLHTDPRAKADMESLLAAQSMVTDEPIRLPTAQNSRDSELVTSRTAARTTGWKTLGWQGLSLSLGGAAAAALLVWAGSVRPLLDQNRVLKAEVEQRQLVDARQQKSFQLSLDKARADAERQALAANGQTAQKLAQVLVQQKGILQENSALTLQLQQKQNALTIAQSQKTALAHANVTLKQDLNRIRITAASRDGLRIPLKNSELAMIASALTQDSLPLHISAALQGSAIVASRSEQGSINPAGTTVLSDRPTLHWNALPEAASYQVIVTDSNAKLIVQTPNPLPAQDPKVPMEWTVPIPLRRGEVYCWQVQAMNRQGKAIANPDFSKLCFQILSREALHRYLDAELKLAILFAHDGLYDSAELLLQEVASADETEPISVQAANLLKDIREQRKKAAK